MVSADGDILMALICLNINILLLNLGMIIKMMLSKFNEMNIKYTYYEYPGGHLWPVRMNDLYHFAQQLFW